MHQSGAFDHLNHINLQSYKHENYDQNTSDHTALALMRRLSGLCGLPPKLSQLFADCILALKLFHICVNVIFLLYSTHFQLSLSLLKPISNNW